MLLWAYNAGIVCFLAYAVSEEVCRLKANGWAFRTTAHRAAPHLSLCDLVALFTGWGALLWIRCIVPTQLRVAMLQCLCSRQRCVVSSAEFGGNALPCSTSTGAWGGALNIYSCYTLQSECRTWNGKERSVSDLALRRGLRGKELLINYDVHNWYFQIVSELKKSGCFLGWIKIRWLLLL